MAIIKELDCVARALTPPERQALDLLARPQAPPDVTIGVTGRRGAWRFVYRQASAPGGEEPCAVADVIVVPQGGVIRLDVTSEDIIHALTIPELKVAVDGVPGRIATTMLDTSRPGAFKGGATKISGAAYREMTFELRVVPAERYAAWVQATLRRAGCGR